MRGDRKILATDHATVARLTNGNYLFRVRNFDDPDDNWHHAIVTKEQMQQALKDYRESGRR